MKLAKLDQDNNLGDPNDLRVFNSNDQLAHSSFPDLNNWGRNILKATVNILQSFHAESNN
jgi:hypothetical protein